jgi:DNA topoisomerase VI subunit B
MGSPGYTMSSDQLGLHEFLSKRKRRKKRKRRQKTWKSVFRAIKTNVAWILISHFIMV